MLEPFSVSTLSSSIKTSLPICGPVETTGAGVVTGAAGVVAKWRISMNFRLYFLRWMKFHLRYSFRGNDTENESF